jgi:hypothetical protein
MRAGQINFRRPALGLERGHVVDGDINMSYPLARQCYLQQALFWKSEIVLCTLVRTLRSSTVRWKRSFNVDHNLKLHLFGI